MGRVDDVALLHVDSCHSIKPSLHLDVHRVNQAKAFNAAHTEGNDSLDHDHEEQINHHVSPLDSSAIDDAASMAGFAQITAEGAGG
jgi:hypothetical protein